MTSPAKAPKVPTIHPAGTKVRVTRGNNKGRETTVYAVVGATHILAGFSGYYSGASLKAI